MASIRKRTQWRLVLEDAWRYKTYPTRKQAEAANEAYYNQGLMGLRVESAPGGGWEARIRCRHAPDQVRSFRRRAEADAWAKEREGEIAKRQFVDYRAADKTSLADLLSRYDRDRLAGRSKDDADKSRIAMLAKIPVAQLRMSVLQPSDLCTYRDERKQQVKGATVTKELELICRVIGIARAEWGIHLAVNPASGTLVKRPKKEPGDERDRRLAPSHVVVPDTDGTEACSEHGGKGSTSPSRHKGDDSEYERDPELDALLKLAQSEKQALLRACRYPHWYTLRKRDVTPATEKARARRGLSRYPVKARRLPGRQIWAVTSFAIETAMRRGELCKLLWGHVRLAEGYLELPWTEGELRCASLQGVQPYAGQPLAGCVPAPHGSLTPRAASHPAPHVATVEARHRSARTANVAWWAARPGSRAHRGGRGAA